jgi:hypothetical protein
MPTKARLTSFHDRYGDTGKLLVLFRDSAGAPGFLIQRIKVAGKFRIVRFNWVDLACRSQPYAGVSVGITSWEKAIIENTVAKQKRFSRRGSSHEGPPASMRRATSVAVALSAAGKRATPPDGRTTKFGVRRFRDQRCPRQGSSINQIDPDAASSGPYGKEVHTWVALDRVEIPGASDAVLFRWHSTSDKWSCLLQCHFRSGLSAMHPLSLTSQVFLRAVPLPIARRKALDRSGDQYHIESTTGLRARLSRVEGAMISSCHRVPAVGACSARAELVD